MNTGEKVKEYRLRNAWSQEQLAELASLSVRTVQRIEKGHKPGLETLSALASVFNVEVAELSGNTYHASKMLDTRINEARRRVEQETHFYRTLIIALLVCGILMTVNYLFSPNRYWSVVVTLVWGSVVAFRALRIFVLKEQIATWQQKRVLRIIREKNNMPAQEKSPSEKND
ncbi:helix-turn-helix domain-containing protein [Budvicia aquatica]|uniref:helix-turn-helix domain-containing protein n=1 Tax=Budvicia aquatica TaxID=82979 RepID=UPI0020818201|nr:helix-turn-helix domain-containing protein [Budvicia aquatica]GKX49894.1 DNA-binding protein [Budvicia aquatica]